MNNTPKEAKKPSRKPTGEKTARSHPVKRKKSMAKELGPDMRLKTVQWAQTISGKTAKKIDTAICQDEYVVKEGAQTAHIIDKVLCLELKRWKIVVQLTDKIVNLLDEKELRVIIRGWSADDKEKTNYLWRKLVAQHCLDTRYMGLTTSKRKKNAYYAAKSYSQTGKKSSAYLVNELAAELQGKYMMKYGDNQEAREALNEIRQKVEAIIDARSLE